MAETSPTILLLVTSQPWIFLSLCYPMRMGWKFFSAESTPLVIQQSPVTWEVIVFVFTLYFICLFIFLFVFFLLLVVVVLYFQISHLEPFFTDTVFRFSFHDSVSGFHIAGLVFCSQSCSEILFFLAAEGMLI